MKTVDLSEKIKEQEEAAQKRSRRHSVSPGLETPGVSGDLSRRKQAIKKNKKVSKSKTDEIDKIFGEEEEDLIDEDLQKIHRPFIDGGKDSLVKKVVYILAFLAIIIFGYLYFQPSPSQEIEAPVSISETGWYAVKLTNGETYYGQIDNLGTDPVIVKNVYYNYDQASGGSAGEVGKTESKNLRLVKRGEEVHGPDGSLSVVRSQVVYMEPMTEDSKVLQAILKNEQ